MNKVIFFEKKYLVFVKMVYGKNKIIVDYYYLLVRVKIFKELVSSSVLVEGISIF